MDLNTAILLGLLEQQVENILPTDLTNIAGQVLTVSRSCIPHIGAYAGAKRLPA